VQGQRDTSYRVTSRTYPPKPPPEPKFKVSSRSYPPKAPPGDKWNVESRSYEPKPEYGEHYYSKPEAKRQIPPRAGERVTSRNVQPSKPNMTEAERQRFQGIDDPTLLRGLTGSLDKTRRYRLGRRLETFGARPEAPIETSFGTTQAPAESSTGGVGNAGRIAARHGGYRLGGIPGAITADTLVKSTGKSSMLRSAAREVGEFTKVNPAIRGIGKALMKPGSRASTLKNLISDPATSPEIRRLAQKVLSQDGPGTQSMTPELLTLLILLEREED